jgi:hypothetical protein
LVDFSRGEWKRFDRLARHQSTGRCTLGLHQLRVSARVYFFFAVSHLQREVHHAGSADAHTNAGFALGPEVLALDLNVVTTRLKQRKSIYAILVCECAAANHARSVDRDYLSVPSTNKQ